MHSPETSVQALCDTGAISRRLGAALLQNGFTDVSEIAGYDPRRLRMLRGLGKSGAAELSAVISRLGLSC